MDEFKSLLEGREEAGTDDCKTEKRDRNERGKKWIKRVDIRRRRIDKLIDVIAARRQLVHGSFHLRSVRRRHRRR